MKFTTHNLPLTALGLALLGGALLAGCSRGPERVAVVPLETKITFEGQPLPGAFVVLHPRADVNPKALPARGYSDQAGTFKATTYDEGDGVAPGEYAVTVEFHQLVESNAGITAGPNVLPPKYSSPQTTDLIIRVADGQKNELPPLNLTR